ncbi:DUF1624 domain-containing protein [Arthrobacter mangrovi]|uniref:Heparan-alpha-glucosaminide N-acetyltransferase catalytic domain-containing protein n=1 Tax=Arthrobacter mangrovi TaxID=2966350 RepID=A0ABQ5MTT8_9MICC|nr:DUF1624 domain-containing protein [Arthrobacter mangrovi]GLB67387.1 hypothetical protein AHIS1636_18270 [Arthrobacter mangrovi]
MDVARGVALIGIVIINLLPSGGAADVVWTLTGGRAAALFALIAGFSIALQSGGRRPPTGRAMTATRAALALRGLMILGMGLLLGYTDTPLDIILPYYGVLFLLAIPLLGLGRRTLLALAVIFAVLGPIAMQLDRAWWPDRPQIDAGYTFGLAAAHPGTFLTDMLLTGVYPALPWLAYICVGLAVGRLNLASRKVAAVLLAAGTALTAFMWALSAFLLGPGGGYERLIAATPLLNRDQINQFLLQGEAPGADDLPTTTGWWLTILTPTPTHPPPSSAASEPPSPSSARYCSSSRTWAGPPLPWPRQLDDPDPLLRPRNHPGHGHPGPGASDHGHHHPNHRLPPRRRPLAQHHRQRPLEAVAAAATGWLRTPVLTGHRPGRRTGEGRQVPESSTSSGHERALEGGPRGDDSRGDGTPAGEAQEPDLVTGRSGPSGQPG